MISWIGKILALVFANRKEITEVVKDIVEAAEPTEPSTPLTYKDVEHKRKQEASATSFKVVKPKD